MTEYANKFAPQTGLLRVHCLHHEEKYKKADAYVIESGGYVLLIDGGMSGSEVTYEYLLGMRREWLASAGLGEDCELPMKLDWLISHCHVDHVSATIEKIIPDARFVFDRVIMPPDSALDPFFHTVGTDGDTKYRPLIAGAFEARGYTPDVIQIGFGVENVVSFKSPDGGTEFTVYPPVADFGVGERLEYMVNGYCDGERTDAKIPTSAINANSIWVRIVKGERSFLFTGDTMKREAHLDREAADQMTEAYRDMIGRVDVMKYFHHGYRRDDAAGLVMSFEPEYIIMSCKDAGGERAVRAAFPDCSATFINCGFGDFLFTTDGHDLTLEQTLSYNP